MDLLLSIEHDRRVSMMRIVVSSPESEVDKMICEHARRLVKPVWKMKNLTASRSKKLSSYLIAYFDPRICVFVKIEFFDKN